MCSAPQQRVNGGAQRLLLIRRSVSAQLIVYPDLLNTLSLQVRAQLGSHDQGGQWKFRRGEPSLASLTARLM
jgi:hypothetical protein